jgi:FAD/FMN-containing dehydrogenases
MDSIIEVNEASRYALIEAGVTQAALRAYLEKHHPHLQHSTPESPPTATIVGNILIQGHGHLTPRYGVNSQMVNGMEVVLPTGEVCKLGSSSISPSWFSRDPLPDLMGLFLGWLGTTGIVTKLSLQLFPKPIYRDLLLFVSDSAELIPEIIVELSDINLLENGFIITQEKPRWAQRIPDPAGAADLGDIGTLFPSQEPEYKDISSLVLLSKTGELLKAKGIVQGTV